MTGPPSGQFPEVRVQRNQAVLVVAANSRERRAATVIGHHPAYPFTGPDLSEDLRVYAHKEILPPPYAELDDLYALAGSG